jgi:hypothetical protein
MIGRILATMIVVFWLLMTGALVHLEYFPKPLRVSEVPPELVLRKIFNNPDSPGMNIYYHGTLLGFCKIDFTPLSGNTELPANSDIAPSRYRVQSEVTLTPNTTTIPYRIRVVGDSYFNAQFEMESFHLRSTIGEGRLEVRGDAASKKVMLDLEMGELRDRREFDFRRIQAAGLSGAIGLPGLSGFGFIGGAPVGPGAPGTTPTTRIYLADLRVGEAPLRSYLVESRFDETLWSKMWVSQRGEILKIETSVGVTMLQNSLAPNFSDDLH